MDADPGQGLRGMAEYRELPEQSGNAREGSSGLSLAAVTRGRLIRGTHIETLDRPWW